MGSTRVYPRNNRSPDPEGRYVLYRIQVHRRFHWNHALDEAVRRANELGKPLLIYEGLRCNYPWASDRFQCFIMQSMKELFRVAESRGIRYIPFIERKTGEEETVYDRLVADAAQVISDEYPMFNEQEQNKRGAKRCPVRYTTVDANGVLPLDRTEKAPYNAYFFRKILQRRFVESYLNSPEQDGLANLENDEKATVPEELQEYIKRSRDDLQNITECIAKLPIDHSVKPVNFKGTRQSALDSFEKFVKNRLHRYHEEANQPDDSAASNMSPWLNFGKISPFELTRRIFEQQPKGWSLDNIEDQGGSRGSFFSEDPNIESYLDELLTWREVGFHFVWHRDEFDTFGSLPNWAQETLNQHRQDERPYIYTLEEFEEARTHDEIWNAAQRQLRREGVIHNYLRMLWGKKILGWTPDPEIALAYMIELNNKYAIDGRDPNSYNGIFWCLGRFDRPWPERKVFGKVRYMTSKSTRKKCRIKKYLRRFGKESEQNLP